MNKIERQLVERIKSAHNIELTANGENMLKFDSKVHNTKKLFHDIAIAVQDYFVKNSTY